VQLARVRNRDGAWLEPVVLSDLAPSVVPALLAAEDQRFYAHPGFDPFATARAVYQNLRLGRTRYGASTLTQQLARTLFDRPRSLWGKLQELTFAISLELRYSKNSILESYLERATFGPNLIGLTAASRAYFDKPALRLSTAEAATLVALLKGPSQLEPNRHSERLLARRNWVLSRMQALGTLPGVDAERAQQSPLVLHSGYVAPGAFHFVRALMRGDLPGAPQAQASSFTTTIDHPLQVAVEGAVRARVNGASAAGVSNASVVVIDNASGAVRAYVGSADPRDTAALGQNDGVLALRSPGSTLKPFVYALAFERLGLHGASLLSDTPERFSNAYEPQNYDSHFHGPVRLRAALSGSLNLPAVTLAERLGPEALVRDLRRFGFASLALDGAHYGAGIALGTAEVRLLELTQAYATLARGGLSIETSVEQAASVHSERVLSAAAAAQVTDVLADRAARAATFGRGGELEFDFPVALKTGTSKNYRDSWVVGFTSAVTVGVWVGNFDGHPTRRATGARTAGPLFHESIELAQRLLGQHAQVLPNAPELTPRTVTVCALSGELAGRDCPESLVERLWGAATPERECSWHHPPCPAPGASSSPQLSPCGVEWPAQYAAFAPKPARRSPSLPSQLARASNRDGQPLAITTPRAGSQFWIDPRLTGAQQRLALTAQAQPGTHLTFVLDGAVLGQTVAPEPLWWPLVAGAHELEARATNGQHTSTHFVVR
jgi:penicillin-binding protein 1C